MSEQVTVDADAEDDDVVDTIAVLQNLALSYTLVDLTQDENAFHQVVELGSTRTPVVEVGTTSWAGFRPALIYALAESTTYDLRTDPMDSPSCDSCQ